MEPTSDSLYDYQCNTMYFYCLVSTQCSVIRWCSNPFLLNPGMDISVWDPRINHKLHWSNVEAQCVHTYSTTWGSCFNSEPRRFSHSHLWVLSNTVSKADQAKRSTAHYMQKLQHYTNVSNSSPLWWKTSEWEWHIRWMLKGLLSPLQWMLRGSKAFSFQAALLNSVQWKQKL